MGVGLGAKAYRLYRYNTLLLESGGSSTNGLNIVMKIMD